MRSSKIESARWGLALFFGAALTCVAHASHIDKLATLDGVAGYEDQVREYVQAQLGSGVEVDNTGSITKTFGKGGPHTLIVAGLDEPGFVVSAITDDGYLRLTRLAEPKPHYQFERLFQAQHVSVITRGGKHLAGVVAAPSVHLDDERGYSSAQTNKDLYVDIGASTLAEARAAGAEILDPVTLNKTLIRFPGGGLSAPWISSRAGAASLLRLADSLAAHPPAATVTLAFVTQQFYYNAGLLRVLQRTPADRAVWIAPSGKPRSQVAPASGWSSKLKDDLLRIATDAGLDFQDASSYSASFGPFHPKEPWPDSEQSAIITIGAEHAGTPIETLKQDEIENATRVLAAFVGVELEDNQDQSSHAPAKPKDISVTDDSLTSLIRELVQLPGVSGAESPVRDWIRSNLPGWAKQQSRIDDHGNLIVPLGTAGPPAAMFIAHTDEIGFKVKGIGPNGNLSVETLGGLNSELFEWHPAVVHTASGALDAVMTTRGEIEIGAASAEEAKSLGVAPGDTVTIPKKWSQLLGERFAARALDDRVGCAVLLRALQSLSTEEVRKLARARPTWVVFSAEEETGLIGAAALAQENAPQRVYAVDSFVTSDSPLENPKIADAPLGEGFVIRAIDSSGISNRTQVERVADLARSNNIPIQYGVTSGGNDGSRFVPYGAVNIPLSWPLRYSHTAGEVSDLRDIEALEKIVNLLVRDELFTH